MDAEILVYIVNVVWRDAWTVHAKTTPALAGARRERLWQRMATRTIAVRGAPPSPWTYDALYAR